MNIEFTGDQEDWDLIWETIRTDMTALAFSAELREQITAAYNRIMDLNDPSRSAPLSEEDIVVGNDYRVRSIEGVKAALRKRIVTCVKKKPLTFTLVSPAKGFLVGNKISFQHWMLEEVTK